MSADRSEISSNYPKEQPTIQDVAEALGLHKSTVSVALSGKGTLSKSTRERILSAATEMGYVPNPIAQRLANGNRNRAVCIFTGLLDIGISTEKILIIQHDLNRASLETPLYTCSDPADNSGNSQAAQIRQICRQRPQAIICASQMINEAVFDELQEFQDKGGCVVSYDVEIPLDCDQVIFSRDENAYDAARFLLQRGHKEIGLGMSNRVDWLTSWSFIKQTARIKGFTRAVEESGGTVNPEWLFHHTTYEKGGEEMAHNFLQMTHRPTALCIVNDYVALAFMVTVMRNGVRIPEDLSVIGHDNQPISEYCPVRLTSATQPAQQIAETVVKMLLERLGGYSGPARKVTISGDIIERESVSRIFL